MQYMLSFIKITPPFDCLLFGSIKWTPCIVHVTTLYFATYWYHSIGIEFDWIEYVVIVKIIGEWGEMTENNAIFHDSLPIS